MKAKTGGEVLQQVGEGGQNNAAIDSEVGAVLDQQWKHQNWHLDDEEDLVVMADVANGFLFWNPGLFLGGSEDL